MNQIINTRPWRGKVIILPNPKSNAQREANPKKNAGVNRKKWKRTVDIDGAVRNQRRRLSSIGALGGRVFGRDFPGRRLWLGDSSRDVALRLLVETLHILRCRRHNPFLFLSRCSSNFESLESITFLFLLRDDSERDGDFLSISVL